MQLCVLGDSSNVSSSVQFFGMVAWSLPHTCKVSRRPGSSLCTEARASCLGFSPFQEFFLTFQHLWLPQTWSSGFPVKDGRFSVHIMAAAWHGTDWGLLSDCKLWETKTRNLLENGNLHRGSCSTSPFFYLWALLQNLPILCSLVLIGSCFSYFCAEMMWSGDRC